MTDAWFRRRTFAWAHWDLAALRDAKARSGTTVSLVIPARNEAATIGEIVDRVRADVVEAARLVDEVVVIDSDSTDDTARVARGAGAVVHAAAGIRPDLGARPGKGEAMWKSLFVTRGDVLVFIDADLVEWDTHFVTGLLGPLLGEDGVDLVKGFYDRPLAGVEAEGGRVTELVARPLLSLHWPELAGVVQPLAGEWAARRSLLERLSVPGGYGVELAALIDTYRTRGIDAIAQVDLGVRRHSHQSLRDLGVMALEQLALVERRIRPTAVPEQGLTLRQYLPGDGDGLVTPVAREVPVGERPPAVDVPGYGAAPGGSAPEDRAAASEDRAAASEDRAAASGERGARC